VFRRPSPIVCAALLVAPLTSAAPVQDAPPPAAPPPRVLVYVVSAGYEHAVARRPEPDARAPVEGALEALGRETGAFEAIVTRDAAWFDPERLKKVDVVFFYTTGELPLSAAERAALFAFVRGGGGFAGAHCAADTFHEVPEYGAMLGAYFDGHPWHQAVRIRVEDREHPATRHLGEAFTLSDEVYQFRAPYDREQLHVLLSLDPASVDVAAPGVHRTDGDFALAWCRRWGKGRVFYTALGHEPAVWRDERFLRHVLGGILWAAGRDPREPEEGAERK
jgi:uncharacterized protein